MFSHLSTLHLQLMLHAKTFLEAHIFLNEHARLDVGVWVTMSLAALLQWPVSQACPSATCTVSQGWEVKWRSFPHPVELLRPGVLAVQARFSRSGASTESLSALEQ